MHGLAQLRESINLPVSIELFDHEHSSPRAFLLCGQAMAAWLIELYVANGYGIGLTVAAPGFKSPPGVSVIPLPGFPPVIVGIAWAGKLSPIAQQFLAEVEIEARVVKRSTKFR